MGRGPDIWERVRADIDAGELVHARHRLMSWIGNQDEPDDQAAEMIALLSWRLGEPVKAGKWWFLTPATGADVDEAVEAFAASLRSHDDLPRVLPQVLWSRREYASLSPAARARFDRFGGERAWKQLKRRAGGETTISRAVWRAGCSLVIMACAFFWLVGVVTVLKWIF